MPRGLPTDQSIHCECGETHRLSTMALVIALQAFIDGEAQYVTVDGHIKSSCVLRLVTESERMEYDVRVKVA